MYTEETEGVKKDRPPEWGAPAAIGERGTERGLSRKTPSSFVGGANLPGNPHPLRGNSKANGIPETSGEPPCSCYLYRSRQTPVNQGVGEPICRNRYMSPRLRPLPDLSPPENPPSRCVTEGLFLAPKLCMHGGANRAYRPPPVVSTSSTATTNCPSSPGTLKGPTTVGRPNRAVRGPAKTTSP